jgi:hypothetical protein
MLTFLSSNYVRVHLRLFIRIKEFLNPLILEVVSKSSIGFKVKADWAGQPQEYREYFEDWTSQSNTEIEHEGRF